jgi:hypothetical protein
MGEGRQDLADLMAVETGEASVSLDAGKAQLPFADRGGGCRRGPDRLRQQPGQPSAGRRAGRRPYPIVTLSDAQIAKIRG